jgi:hypothetical protein
MKNSQSPLNSDSDPLNESWLFSRTGIVTIGALAILALLVYSGHSAHLLGYLPFLLLLACPLMHIFMHGGHGHSEHRRGPTSDDESAK